MDEVLGVRRFQALFEGVGSAAHDRPLLVNTNWIVAPTLGAIVPGWILAIPRRPVLNFSRWAKWEGKRPESVLNHILEHLGLSSQEIIWFEHGPKSTGTTVGCGLDHAHIHILIRPPFSFEEFEAAATSLADVDWQRLDAQEGYAAIADGQSYLIAGSGNSVISALEVEGVGSQFFRRVVSKLASLAGWDYRDHPHIENIAKTISTFRFLESAARRER